MLKSLEQVSKDELRSLVDFSRALVVKAQEVADAAEIEALSRAGVSFTPVDRPARDWEQIVGYAVPGTTTIETQRETAWYHRISGSEAAVFGIDVQYGIWQKFSETSWLNVATGQPRTTADPSWTLLSIPAGESYIDAVRGRYLVPVLVWLDHTTGETSALGPGDPALPADLRDAGQPVLIGGTMGTASYILAGTVESMGLAFGSACHGAGRTMSRKEATKKWNGREVMDQLEKRGVFIRTRSYRGVAEEAPGAYKDVSAVVDATHAAGLSRKVAKLVPLACIKG